MVESKISGAVTGPAAKLDAKADPRPRALVTNMLCANGLFSGQAKVTITPIDHEAALAWLEGKRPILFLTQHAYMTRLDDNQVAMLTPNEVGQVFTDKLDMPLYNARGEFELPLKSATTFLLGEVVAKVSRKSKVLLQVGKPRLDTEIDWSLVEVELA